MELVARIVATVIPVASIDPVLVAVETTLLIVPLGANTLPALIELVARIVATVIPVALIDPVLVAVATTLLMVPLGA
jgi:hypothetical protein